MPILHVQFDGSARLTDGTSFQIPPADAMRQHGPLLQVAIGISQDVSEQLLNQGLSLPEQISGNALIDTGASTSCIDDEIAVKMGLPIIDVVNMMSASHPSVAQNVYPIQMHLAGSNITIEIPHAVGANLASQGLIALIGRDFLQHCTFHYNGVSGQITLSV